MVEFDEIAVRNEMIEVLRQGFADYNDILKTEVQIDSEEPQETSFPCCIVSVINPVSEQKYDDDCGSFRKIRFSLECDLYAKELGNFTLSDSISKLSQTLVKIIIQKYPTFIVTRNASMPYRTDVKRRIIDFSCVYDVEDKIIYSN